MFALTVSAAVNLIQVVLTLFGIGGNSNIDL